MSAKKRTSSRLRAAAQERMKVTGEKYTTALAAVTRGENPPIITEARPGLGTTFDHEGFVNKSLPNAGAQTKRIAVAAYRIASRLSGNTMGGFARVAALRIITEIGTDEGAKLLASIHDRDDDWKVLNDLQNLTAAESAEVLAPLRNQMTLLAKDSEHLSEEVRSKLDPILRTARSAGTRYPVEEIVRRRVAPDSGDDMGGAVFDASRAAVEIIDALRDSGLDIPLVMSDVAYEPREWETEKITDAKSAVYDILHRELDRSWADEEGYDTIGHADAAVESLIAGGARFPEVGRTVPRPVTLPVFDGEDMVLDMKSHVLVAGAAGTGKTVLIERIAQSLLDLGDEVWVSSAYPVRVTPSLLFDADEVAEMLREATNIMNGRYERMNEIGASTYAEAGLRGLVVVVDDAFGREWGKESSDVLARLTRLGGAAGIRVVVSSQISPNGPVGRHEEDFTHRVLMGRTIQGIAQFDTPESVTARLNRGQGIYRDAAGRLKIVSVRPLAEDPQTPSDTGSAGAGKDTVYADVLSRATGIDFDRGSNLLITGSAGTGKTVLMNEIAKEMRSRGLEVNIADPRFQGKEYGEVETRSVEEVIQHAYRTMVDRAQALKERKLHHAKHAGDMPPVFLLIDYADYMFPDFENEGQGKIIQSDAYNQIKMLLRGGRNAGIHVVVGLSRVMARSWVVSEGLSASYHHRILMGRSSEHQRQALFSASDFDFPRDLKTGEGIYQHADSDIRVIRVKRTPDETS